MSDLVHKCVVREAEGYGDDVWQWGGVLQQTSKKIQRSAESSITPLESMMLLVHTTTEIDMETTHIGST